MTIRVVIGTVLIAATMMIVTFVMINEPARMPEFEAGFKGRSIEAGAALFQSSCTPCHGIQGKGIEGVGPSLNAADLFSGKRLKEFGWAGTVKDYVRSAIAGGRPRASAAFANYPNPNAVGTDINVQLPQGDAANGEKLFTGKGPNGAYACSACHSLEPNKTVVGPSFAGLAGNAAKRKEGTSAEKYFVESIIKPNDFLVPGFNANLMQQNFGQLMDKKELADIIAYLMTLK
ncbi:MAG: c-type cytochrome [Chloroflexi bacterium]|nr:c-type cytochrome [Chloroflexota bacterium]